MEILTLAGPPGAGQVGPKQVDKLATPAVVRAVAKAARLQAVSVEPSWHNEHCSQNAQMLLRRLLAI